MRLDYPAIIDTAAFMPSDSYQVRACLFDENWLSETTGLDYGDIP